MNNLTKQDINYIIYFLRGYAKIFDNSVHSKMIRDLIRKLEECDK